MIFGDFLKSGKFWVFFTVALYSRLMVHSKKVFWYLRRLTMKISEGGRGGERMDHAQLIQGFSDQLRWQMPIFLFQLLSWFLKS